jgi:hypothetical protein
MRCRSLLIALALLANEPLGRADTPEGGAVQAKWVADIYGFVELDAIHDSTEAYWEVAGASLIPRPGTYGAGHGRTMLAIRDSRLGLRLAAPEFFKVKASAVLEMDFLGNQPSGTEAQIFNNPAFRARRVFLKLETPLVDILAGQEWQLFGGQPFFLPNSIEIPGWPGVAFGRTPQLRASYTVKQDAINVEVAAAAVRPVQRDSEAPDGQAAVRASFNRWRGVHTVAGTGTSEDAASVQLSGLIRSYNVARLEKASKTALRAMGWGGSVDLMLPLIPATKEKRGNALTLTGSGVIGSGIADVFGGMTGGWVLPTKLLTGESFTPNLDNGLVMYNSSGGVTPVEWRSFVVGLQYYLPPNGALWVSANYSQMGSPNARSLGAGAAGFDSIQWANGNFFWDVVPAVRVGVGYSWTRQHYGDGVLAQNHRVQCSAFYLF